MSNKTEILYLTMKKAAQVKFDEAKVQDEPGMMAMYAADARDMFAIARMIKEGNIKAAYDKACYMDTAARDEIPDEVYEYLEEEANS